MTELSAGQAARMAVENLYRAEIPTAVVVWPVATVHAWRHALRLPRAHTLGDSLRCGLYPSEGPWRTRSEMLSPAYTMRWEDVCRVAA